MPGIVGHLVSRGLEASAHHYHAAKGEAHVYQLPTWGIGMLSVTLITFMALTAAVR